MGSEKLDINIFGITLFATCVNRKGDYAKFRSVSGWEISPYFMEIYGAEFLSVIRLITSFGRNRVMITSSR